MRRNNSQTVTLTALKLGLHLCHLVQLLVRSLVGVALVLDVVLATLVSGAGALFSLVDRVLQKSVVQITLGAVLDARSRRATEFSVRIEELNAHPAKSKLDESTTHRPDTHALANNLVSLLESLLFGTSRHVC